MIDSDQRPDPDALLERIESGTKGQAGKLKVFFGYAAGVGKTYSMLEEARILLKEGVDSLRVGARSVSCGRHLNLEARVFALRLAVADGDRGTYGFGHYRALRAERLPCHCGVPRV